MELDTHLEKNSRRSTSMLDIAGVMRYTVLVGMERVLSRNLVGSWDDGNKVLKSGKVLTWRLDQAP